MVNDYIKSIVTSQKKKLAPTIPANSEKQKKTLKSNSIDKYTCSKSVEPVKATICGGVTLVFIVL